MWPQFRWTAAPLCAAVLSTACASGSAGADSAVATEDTVSTTSSAGGASLGPAAPLGTETCGNGLDDNGDGQVDEGCPCSPGATQVCCTSGTQVCSGQEFPIWGPCQGVTIGPEICDGAHDENCDGHVDEGCGGTATTGAGGAATSSGQGGTSSGGTTTGQGGSSGTGSDPCAIQIPVDIYGDCVTTSCPPQAPYPVGCNIVMSGDDSRGCVANAPGSSVVYFQEGNDCGAGHVSGYLICSCNPGAPLGAANCPINKSEQFYGPGPWVCPAT